MYEVGALGSRYTASIAFEQAKRAGVSGPFTRTFDQRTGRVTITPRRRTRAERNAAYDRRARSMTREARYATLAREVTPSNQDRHARYDELVRELGRPRSNRLPAKSGMVYD